MSKQSDAKYVADMLQYAQEALDLAHDLDTEQFRRDRRSQLALSHLVQIIGEAAFHTNDATRAALPDVAWPEIIGMRHRLVHDYGNVSYELVWDVVRNDLRPLIAALEGFTPPEPPSA